MINITEELLERFCSKYVMLENECWHWVAGQFSRGYGCFYYEGYAWLAHRFSYVMFTDPDLHWSIVVHHKCRNQLCVNPDHLEAMSSSQHKKQHPSKDTAVSRHLKGSHNRNKLQCKRGHLLTSDNVRVDKTGSRNCVECRRQRDRLRYKYGKGPGWKWR